MLFRSGPGDPSHTPSSSGATALDANSDGHADVLVVNAEQANDLYLGDGKGGWTKDTSSGGPGDPIRTQYSRGVTALDANGDGHADVLVVNYKQANDLYLGDGKGGWTKDTSTGGPGDPNRAQGSHGVTALDANGEIGRAHV